MGTTTSSAAEFVAPDFFAITSTGSQATMAAACIAEGGSIASFHDDAEFQEASALCQSACEAYDSSNSGCGCWTGLKDDLTEGNWYNEDGSDKQYVMDENGNAYTGVYPWYSGEPNDSNGEDCVHIWRTQGYLLNDIDCGASYMAICRVNPVATFSAVRTKSTQAEAADVCERRGKVIASFHRDYEYEAAAAVCERICDRNDPDDASCGCWTGIRNLESDEDVWYNEDGSAQDYLMDSSGSPFTGVAPWYTGEPNDSGGEDCAHIWKQQNYMINDIDCSGEYYAICKDLPEPVPSEYFVIEEEQTQGEGALACEANNARIASFHSEQDYASAKDLCETACESSGISGCGCWTGIRDDISENTFYNEDGSNKDYLMNGAGIPNTGVDPWYSGEPNNSGGEDCVHIWSSQDYYLNDISCTGSYYTMCERHPGDMLSSDTNALLAETLTEFEKELQTNQYWMMLFTAAAALLCFSCLVLTYCNFCRNRRSRQQYTKVIMDSEFAESDCEKQELNNQ